MTYEEIAAGPESADPRAVDPASTCLMLYTSGTTGRPKGVPRSHDAERNASFNCVAQLHYGYGEVQLGVMPLFHTMGIRALGMAAALNGTFVCMPGFDAGEALRLIEAERIDALFLVPTMFHDMVHHPGIAAADLSSVRHIGFAGMSMTSALTGACAEVFEPEIFVNFYGSSEIYSFAALRSRGRQAGLRRARGDRAGAPRGLRRPRLRERSRQDPAPGRDRRGDRADGMPGRLRGATGSGPIPTPSRSGAAGTSPGTSAISTGTGSSFSSAGSTT